jgi:hypothetical protein
MTHAATASTPWVPLDLRFEFPILEDSPRDSRWSLLATISIVVVYKAIIGRETGRHRGAGRPRGQAN